MTMKLIEKTRQTRMIVGIKEYPFYKHTIDALITVYGGKEEKRNSRCIYFVINADVLNNRRAEE